MPLLGPNVIGRQDHRVVGAIPGPELANTHPLVPGRLAHMGQQHPGVRGGAIHQIDSPLPIGVLGILKAVGAKLTAQGKGGVFDPLSLYLRPVPVDTVGGEAAVAGLERLAVPPDGVQVPPVTIALLSWEPGHAVGRVDNALSGIGAGEKIPAG